MGAVPCRIAFRFALTVAADRHIADFADAVAGFAGGPIGLEALGVGRARAVGTIAAGLVQRVTDGLDLFSTVSAQTGRDDHREAISTGVRLRF